MRINKRAIKRTALLTLRYYIIVILISIIVVMLVSNSITAQQVKNKQVEIKFQELRNENLEKQVKELKAKSSRGQASNISKVNNWESHAKGLLKGQGEYVVGLCGNEIDSDLILAIARHETTNGTSRAIRELKNPGGIMKKTGGLMDFSNDGGIKEGFRVMVQTLKNYKTKGIDTIPEIQKIYCPVGAKNDPTNLNKNWLPCVTKYYKEVKGT